ncbi:MAG: hypothetical protein R3C68_13165 [Myxococcota bacterium]
MDVDLDILADALQNSAFDPDELYREIDVVVEIKRAEDSLTTRFTGAVRPGLRSTSLSGACVGANKVSEHLNARTYGGFFAPLLS